MTAIMKVKSNKIVCDKKWPLVINGPKADIAKPIINSVLVIFFTVNTL